jgi:hypothetical protein
MPKEREASKVRFSSKAKSCNVHYFGAPKGIAGTAEYGLALQKSPHLGARDADQPWVVSTIAYNI